MRILRLEKQNNVDKNKQHTHTDAKKKTNQINKMKRIAPKEIQNKLLQDNNKEKEDTSKMNSL